MPEMTQVNSSHVWEIGYDADTATLHVRFAPSVKHPAGRLVVYGDEESPIDPETASQVMTALSVGGALNDLIKGRGFPFK